MLSCFASIIARGGLGISSGWDDRMIFLGLNFGMYFLI